jgi:hypothetical protein
LLALGPKSTLTRNEEQRRAGKSRRRKSNVELIEWRLWKERPPDVGLKKVGGRLLTRAALIFKPELLYVTRQLGMAAGKP